MRTNTIISSLCVVGIIAALCGCDKAIDKGLSEDSLVFAADEPRATAEPIVIPVQKVVYWRDVPGMKWDWVTQVTNAPSIPSASSFVQKSGDTMTGNLTIDSGESDSNIKIMNSESPNGAYTKLTAYGLISGTDYGSFTLQLPTKAGRLALTSDIPSTNGLAAKSYVDSHKWDWSTQVTNSPFVLHTTGFPYVEIPIGFAATDSGQGYAVPSSASFAGAKVHGVESLGAGDGIITNCYGGIGLGMAFNVTNDVAFVWSGRSYNAAVKYGSHGNGTFNVNPNGGLSGFWIGETNLATYLTPVKTTVNTTKGLVSITAEQQAAITALYPNVSNGAKVILMKGNGTGPNGYPSYDLYLGSASGSTSMFGSCELYPDGTIRLYAGMPDLVAIFGPTQAGNPTWLQTPAIVGYEPYYYAYQGTKLTPYDEVKDLVSDAIPNQIVTRINGKTGGLDIGVFGDETSVSVKTNFPSGIEIGSVIVQEGWHSVSVVEEDQSTANPGVNPAVTNKLYVPSDLSYYNNNIHLARMEWREITDSTWYPTLAFVDDTDFRDCEVPYIVYLSGGSASFALRAGGRQFYPENWVTETITNGLISQAWVNSQPFVKTNAQGTVVVGPNQYQSNGGHWSVVVGGGGSHTKSDNTLILSPASNIGTNSHYSAVFGPGAHIYDNASYSFAFGGGINIQDSCNDSFVIGSGAQSAHKCAFLWSANSNGGRNIPAQPITHGNGTFNINTYDGVAGVYIGDTNLQQIIRLEAKAMIHDAVSQVNVNLQSAEDTRAALTNLITILKNL